MKNIPDIPIKALPYLASRCTEQLLRTGWIDTLSYDELKQSKKHQYWQIDESENHKITQPDSIDTDIYLNATQNRVDKIPGSREILTKNEPIQYKINVTEPYVAELNNVSCIGPHGLIVTDDCEFLIELRNNMQSDIRHILFESYYYSPKETLSGIFNCRKNNKTDLNTACSMLQTRALPNNMSYGHWLLEKLPKLRGVEHYENKTGNRVKLLIDPHLSEWQRELLSICGKPEKDWIIWSDNSAQINNFVLPKWERRTFCFSDIDWVTNKIEQSLNFEQHLNEYSNRIYISRQNTDRRRIKNIEELRSMLDSYGFEIVAPEELDFEEQVAMYKNAGCIVGTPGGAFANIAFAENATIIPLTHPKMVSHFHMYYELAEVLNSGGRRLRCKPVISQDPDVEGSHSDYEIPVEQLERRIESILAL